MPFFVSGGSKLTILDPKLATCWRIFEQPQARRNHGVHWPSVALCCFHGQLLLLRDVSIEFCARVSMDSPRSADEG